MPHRLRWRRDENHADAQILERPLLDALIKPFLNAFNKKRADQPPVTPEQLKRVEINAKAVAMDAIAGEVLAGPKAHMLADANPRVELFPPWSTAPIMAPPKPAAPPPAPPKPAASTGPTKIPNAQPASEAPTDGAAPTTTADAAPPAAAAAEEPSTAPAAPAGAATAAPKLASNTMPRCKYGIACRIIDPKVEMTSHLPVEQQHWYKFQHPCYWICKEGHPDLGPPGCLCPLDPAQYAKKPHLAKLIVPCTNMDPDHRRCFRHPEDDAVEEEVVDESADDLDLAVVTSEAPWTPPTFGEGEVSDEAAAEAKGEAAEAAAAGDFEKAATSYSKALAAAPSALTYAKRAEALLRMGRPTAALADCTTALELNPDSAKTYKVAAKALARKGEWQPAYEKLCTGNKIDEDDDSRALQKQLQAKVAKMKKIEELRAKRAAAAAEAKDEKPVEVA